MLASIGIISDAPATSSIESWKPIAGYEGLYEVSDRGRLLSHKGLAPKILSPHPDTSRHLKVGLRDGRGQRRMRCVHKLVMEAFVGYPPPGMEVRHLDGNPANNVLENLAYGTRTQNHQDRKWHRTARGYHKLFGHEASEIKARLAAGERNVDLAREFGIHQTTVSHIKRGRHHCDA